MFRSGNLIRSARRLLAAGSFILAVASLANGSEPSSGMLGVTLTDWAGRVLVKDVYVGGPAYVAGLRPEDRIVAVGHKVVNTSAQLMEVLAEYGPNDRVEIYASRDGWMKDLPVTLAKARRCRREAASAGQRYSADDRSDAGPHQERAGSTVAAAGTSRPLPQTSIRAPVSVKRRRAKRRSVPSAQLHVAVNPRTLCSALYK